MIYDIITYNGESDLFDLRYNILKDYVDEFRVVEFDKTFSGKPRKRAFLQMYEKVKCYYITEDVWSKYRELAESSPNTKGAIHWKTEFAQKESIKDCLTDLKDDDICFIGDCDEVYEELMGYSEPRKLRLRVYTYWLNNRSSEEFFGPLMARYGEIKSECLNHLRTNVERDECEHGWHFTSLKDKLKQKLTDSYTEESYATKEVLDNLEDNIENNRDFLGREFTYKIDESEWPQYLKDNREKYKHLLKKE